MSRSIQDSSHLPWTAHRPIKSWTSIAAAIAANKVAANDRTVAAFRRKGFLTTLPKDPPGHGGGPCVGQWPRAYRRDPLVDAISEVNGCPVAIKKISVVCRTVSKARTNARTKAAKPAKAAQGRRRKNTASYGTLGSRKC